MPANIPLITLDNISVRIGGEWPLRKVSWQINLAENWAIWGSNGAGKTTLAKTILDQTAVVQGSVHRHYLDPSRLSDWPFELASISSEQHNHLYLREQLLDEMAHFSGKTGRGTRAEETLEQTARSDPARTSEIVRQLGLGPILKKPLGVLSAGEMRKLLIARALIVNPDLLILDEPFNGLDQWFQDQLRHLLGRLCASGVQMVLITHRLQDIPEAFTHVLHLENGGIQWKGPIKTFVRMEMGRPRPEAIGSPEKDAIPKSNSQADAPASGSPLIWMRHLSVRYGPHQVLTDIQWTVREGENWALTGPNGAGKSTLLRLINGDNLQGYANELFIFGKRKGSGESVWQIRQKIGYVSDDLQLRYQKKMSGFDVICSGFFDSVGLYRRCTRKQKQIAGHWLEKTGISDLARQSYSKLSFGQQRMVLIVRAMVKSPRLLILDEPCNGLDQDNRIKLLDMLDIIGRGGATNLLYVSHRPDEIPTCITHRLHIEKGRVKKIETL